MGDPLWCLRTGEGTHCNGQKKNHFTKIRAWTDDSMKDLLAASQDRLFGEPAFIQFFPTTTILMTNTGGLVNWCQIRDE